MRALVLSALVLASASLLALVACDQDYASSTDARETFMGDTKEVVSDAAAPPKAPPMAPPQMGPTPPPVPAPAQGDASTDAAPSGSASSAASARAAGLRPPAH